MITKPVIFKSSVPYIQKSFNIFEKELINQKMKK